jgi:hypothetical protein
MPERYARLRGTTEKLIKQAAALLFDLQGGIAQRLVSVPHCSRTAVLDALAQPWCVEPLAAHGLAPPEIVAHAEMLTPKAKNIRYHLGRLVPPIVLETLNTWRRPTS